MKIREIKINDYKGLKNIDLNFENENNKILDIIVIAGNNGSGKTRILNAVIHYFKKNEIIKNKEISNNEANNNYEKEKISINLENIGDKEKIIYVPIEINFQKIEKVYNNLEKEYKLVNIIDSNLVNDVPSYIATRIVELANVEEDKTMGEIRTIVFEEINNIFETLDLDIKLSEISKDSKSIPIFTNNQGEKFNINELSSGEKQLFLRTLSIKMLEPKNSIIMIDEPELSLHPKWQQKIIDVYRKIGENNQIIIATHSPHILGSVPKDNIILLSRNENGNIEVIKGDDLYDSYGQSTDRVLKDIMGLETTRNPKIHNMLEDLKNLIDENKYEDENFQKKYNKLRKILGEKDEDMLLIDMDIQIRKKRGL